MNKAPQAQSRRVMASAPKIVPFREVEKAAKNAGKVQVKPKGDAGKKPLKPVPAPVAVEDTENLGPVLGSTRMGALKLDLSVLLRTRMLITASSGAGKSYAMRRVIEQTAPLVQQIVLDQEGEFDSLTEKFPFVVVNNRSRIPLAECSPYALAQELVRKEVSAVIDISEFDSQERDHFVARFILGLMKLPQDVWRPVMVFLDEAHLCAPQQGKSEAKKAVSDLACRGRKRGYCAVMATNRLSLLSKSVASELQNRLIGQTGLDTDIRRAADELGMARHQAISTLTNLEPGNFVAFGPALSKTVRQVAIGPVQTTHGVTLGDIRAPVTPTDEMMDEIFRLAKPPVEDKKSQTADTQEDIRAAKAAQREDIRKQVAERRLRILAPILALAEDSPDRGAAISRAVEQSSMNRQTLYNWLNAYDPTDPIGSLAPARVPRNWTEELPPAAEAKPRAKRKKVIRFERTKKA